MTQRLQSVLLAEFHFNGGFEKRFIATSTWYSKPTDSIGRREYLGRIAEEPTWRTAVSCYVWGGASATSIGAMTVIDVDNQLTDWLGLEYRDSVCVLRLASAGQSYDDTEIIGTCIIDDLERIDGGFRIQLKGRDTLLDLPAQSQTYPSTVPNAALEGESLPIALGYFWQVEPTAYDRTGLEFRVSDCGQLSITDVLSGGSPATGPGPTDQWDYNAPRYDGFILDVAPGAKLLCNGGGGQGVDASMLEATGAVNDFSIPANWTAGVPTSWSWIASGSPAYTLTEMPGIGARFYGTTDGLTSRTLLCEAGLTPGAWYVLVGKIARNNGGGLKHNNSGRIIKGEGEFAIIWLEETGGDLTLTHDPAQLGDIDITIQRLECYSMMGSIENLTGMIEHLAIARGGLTKQDLLLSDYMDGGNPNPVVGYSNKDSQTVRQIITTAMNSVTGWWWVNQAGKLKLGRLRVPDHEATPALVASRLNIVGAYPVFTPDMAPGLSDTFVGARNWVQYTQDELAGITYDEQEPFMVDYRIKRQTSAVLRRAYRHAIGAKPAESYMQDATEVQTEADRVGDIYATRQSSTERLGQPGFWSFAIAMPDDFSAAAVEVDDLIGLDDDEDLFGVYAGLNAIIVDKSFRLRNNVITILAWVCP